MGRKSPKQKVFRYLMGLHFGVCYGPVDRFLRFLAGDRQAWSGSVTGNSTVAVDAPELFGGNGSEGGLSGSLTTMMGAPAQTLPGNVAAALPSQPPAFRGVFSLFYDGLISTNNPYVKPMAFQVERIKEGWAGGCWYPGTASIPIPATTSPIADLTFTSFELDAGWETNAPTMFTVGPSGIANTTLQAANTDYWRRSIPAGFDVQRLITTFRLTSLSLGDPIGLRLSGEGGDLISFMPRGESTVGIGQPYINYWGAFEAIPIDPLLAGIDYTFDAEIDHGAGTWTYRLAQGATTLHTATKTLPTITPTHLQFGRTSNANPSQISVAVFSSVRLISSYSIAFAAMNPAHIIYQCLTDSQWGMGYPAASIDNSSFTAAADTLFDEDFGLCMLWNTSDEIGAFVGKVLDHAGGVLYTDPQTGKFCLKLLRADYDPGSLSVFDESNIVSLESFQRVGYGDTVNEIVVVYRDVLTNTDVPVAVQNLANIQAQGGVVSQTRQYPGLPTESLALRVAQRDLDASSIPLAKARIKVNRKGWNLTPGAVFKLTWPKLGLSAVIMRALGIDSGTLADGTITVDCAEDVFGLPASTYAEQEPAGWVPPDTDPVPIARQAMFEAPYYLLARGMTPADLAALDADASYFAAAASRPTSLSVGFEIQSRVGAAAYAQTGSGLFVPGAELAAAVGQEAAALALAAPTELHRVSAGMLAIVGDGRAAEVMLVTAVDTSSVSVSRGVLDTTPQEHAAGAPVFFIAGDGEEARDLTERATGEEIDYRLLPQTTGAQLDPALSTPMTVTADQRQARPLPPGNLQINGEMFPTSVSSAITVTWAHRNRLQQTEGIVLQTDGSVTPEAGTTYSGYVYDDDTDELLGQLLNHDGTAWPLSVPGGRQVRLELGATRDGLTGWQRQVRRFAYAEGLALTEGGDPILTEDGGLLLLERAGIDAVDLAHWVTFTVGGEFQEGSRFWGALQVGAVWRPFDIVATGLSSLAELAAAVGAELTTELTGLAQVEVDGVDVHVRSGWSIAVTDLHHLFGGALGFERQQEAKAPGAGGPQWSFVDLYQGDGPSSLLSPDNAPAFRNLGPAAIRLWVEGRTWSAKKELAAAGTNGAGSWGTRYVNVPWSIVLDSDSRATQLVGLADAINGHSELSDRDIGSGGGLVLYQAPPTPLTSMTRHAVGVGASGEYGLIDVWLFPAFAPAAHPSGYLPRLRRWADTGPAYPSGAKELWTFGIGVGASPNPPAGWHFRVTLDGTDYDYVCSGAEDGAEGIVAGLAAEIEPGGFFTVTWYANRGLVEIERTAVNTPFTAAGFSEYGATLTATVHS